VEIIKIQIISAFCSTAAYNRFCLSLCSVYQLTLL